MEGAEERIGSWRTMDHPVHAVWAVQIKDTVQHAFASGLKRVVAVTAPANTASQRVCGRIGMRHLGQTTEYYNSLCELFEATAP